MINSRKAPCSSCGDVSLVHALDEGHPLCKDCYTLGSEQADMAHIYAQISLVFFVAPRHLPDMEKAFARLGRRAERLNLGKPSFKVAGEFFEEYFYGEGFPKSVGVRKLQVVLVNPARSRVGIDGHRFLATIELGAEGNMVRAIPGEIIPKHFRATDGTCEHCNKVRSRKEVFLMRTPAGTIQQIGRNCLVDFFGTDALKYADQADYLSSLNEALESACASEDEDSEFGGGGKSYVKLDQFLAYCAEVISVKGWISRAQVRDSGGEATADTAIKHLFRNFRQGEIPLFSKISTHFYARAHAAMLWAENQQGEDISDYLHNLRVLAKRGYLSMRDLGIAASMIQAAERDGEYQARALAPKRASQYLGTVGEKIQLTLRCEKVITIDGQFGTSYLHIFTDADGNTLKWFASNERLDEKESYQIRGTVKSHNEYKGSRQTSLTRCSVIKLRAFFSPSSDALIHAEDEKLAAKMLRDMLGVKKLGKGQSIHEFSLMSA